MIFYSQGNEGAHPGKAENTGINKRPAFFFHIYSFQKGAFAMNKPIYQRNLKAAGFHTNPSAKEIEATQGEENGDKETDETIEKILKAADKLPEESRLDFTMTVIRPVIKELEPADRRQFCADMEASLSNLYGKETGRFFNGFASAHGPGEPDYEALGRKIMEKRNRHYRPDKQ